MKGFGSEDGLLGPRVSRSRAPRKPPLMDCGDSSGGGRGGRFLHLPLGIALPGIAGQGMAHSRAREKFRVSEEV
jgi:hypothetical protein